MHLHEHVEPERIRAASQRSEIAWRQSGDDQQHSVGPSSPNLDQLILHHDEILPKHEHVDSRADRLQILERAVENGGLDDREERNSPRRRVRRGNRQDVEIAANHSARKRPPLALGDQIHPIYPTERRAKATGTRGSPFGATPQIADRLPDLSHLDDPPRGREDRLEQIDRHPAIISPHHTLAPAGSSPEAEMETSRSSVRLASPRSI